MDSEEARFERVEEKSFGDVGCLSGNWYLALSMGDAARRRSVLNEVVVLL
jgi:hypothetical protein